MFATAAAEKPAEAPERVRDIARGEMVLGLEATPVATAEPTLVPAPEPTPAPTPAAATLAPLPEPDAP